ncbi:MAG TPA: NAD-dependent deacylase [Caldilineae bacterium]|nr:NAD-dependent deacylase [Caldilineae bacterium]
MDPIQFQTALDLLRDARRVVALTGAGSSTPSGIPDFRSNDTGLWSKVDPFTVASVWGFRENPQRFYNWMRPLAGDILAARPNAAHQALERLERCGKLHLIITQNIDALHQKAGSQSVIELHGNLRTVSCPTCAFADDAALYLDAFIDDGVLPICPQCNAVLKPDIVLFGDPLPEKAIVQAQEEALMCDLMLVAGSSLEVMPAADLPALAVRSGARLILVNLGLTPYDHLADVILRGDVEKVLPKLADALENS